MSSRQYLFNDLIGVNVPATQRFAFQYVLSIIADRAKVSNDRIIISNYFRTDFHIDGSSLRFQKEFANNANKVLAFLGIPNDPIPFSQDDNIDAFFIQTIARGMPEATQGIAPSIQELQNLPSLARPTNYADHNAKDLIYRWMSRLIVYETTIFHNSGYSTYSSEEDIISLLEAYNSEANNIINLYSEVFSR